MKPFEARVKQSYYVRVAIVGLLTLGLGALLMVLQQRVPPDRAARGTRGGSVILAYTESHRLWQFTARRVNTTVSPLVAIV